MDKELRTLIIEDSIDDAYLIAHELERGGGHVIWKRAETEHELRNLLLEGSWDIVLSDYTMPQFNAIEAIKIIREINPDLPCIIISGTIGEEIAVAAMQAGAQDFFVKGRLARLSAAIRRQLIESENLRQRRKAELELEKSEKQRWQEHEEALQHETQARQKIETLYYDAQEANRMKENFLHNLSHELRTPMNAITGWAELLVSGSCDSKEYPKIFASIYRNAQIQNRLINDLLDLSRIVTGKLKIERQLVDLEKVTQAGVESIQLMAQKKQIGITLRVQKPIGFVFGDASRLQEVVWNLLSNAVKFTPSGGHIDIDIHPKDPFIELQIKDSGEGIEPQFLPYIFDRFRQADGSLTRKHGGLGLGLSIVRQLVELHDGQVEAYSEGVGKGTTLTVRLPVKEIKMLTTAKEKTSVSSVPKIQEPLRGLCILIVDDSLDSLTLLEYILRKHGAKIISTTSGEKACELVREKHPHILLCDIEMPEKNGYEVIRQVRKEERGSGAILPAIALTAHVRPEDIERAKIAGFNMHLAKPIEAENLINTILNLHIEKL